MRPGTLESTFDGLFIHMIIGQDDEKDISLRIKLFDSYLLRIKLFDSYLVTRDRYELKLVKIYKARSSLTLCEV